MSTPEVNLTTNTLPIVYLSTENTSNQGLQLTPSDSARRELSLGGKIGMGVAFIGGIAIGTALCMALFASTLMNPIGWALLLGGVALAIFSITGVAGREGKEAALETFKCTLRGIAVPIVVVIIIGICILTKGEGISLFSGLGTRNFFPGNARLLDDS